MTKTYWVQEFHLQAGGANSLETINRLKHPYPKSQYSIGGKVRTQNKSGKQKVIFSKQNNVKRVITYKYMPTFIQIKVCYCPLKNLYYQENCYLQSNILTIPEILVKNPKILTFLLTCCDISKNLTIPDNPDTVGTMFIMHARDIISSTL